jgi:hypothetical protein
MIYCPIHAQISLFVPQKSSKAGFPMKIQSKIIFCILLLCLLGVLILTIAILMDSLIIETI